MAKIPHFGGIGDKIEIVRGRLKLQDWTL